MPILWADAYQPKNFASLDYHHNVNKLLESIGKSKNISHLILYGPRGSGKQTRCRLLLKTLFNDETLKMKAEAIELENKITISLINSQYHTEIFAADITSKDKQCIQILIKQLCGLKTTKCFIEKKYKPNYRIIVIHDAETLNILAQASLRRTMEIYAATSRFIFLTENLNGIIGPLQSRCICIRIPLPSMFECLVGLEKIINACGGNISRETQQTIITAARNDMLTSIVMAQRYQLTKKIIQPTWKILVCNIKDIIIKQFDTQTLSQIHQILDDLYVKCIEHNEILEELIYQLIHDNRVQQSLLLPILNIASHFASTINESSKPVLHLLACTSYIVYTLTPSN